MSLIGANVRINNALELAYVDKVSVDSESGNVIVIAQSNEGDKKLDMGSSKASSRGSEIIIPKEATPMYGARFRHVLAPLASPISPI